MSSRRLLGLNRLEVRAARQDERVRAQVSHAERVPLRLAKLWQQPRQRVPQPLVRELAPPRWAAAADVAPAQAARALDGRHAR
eukprot:6885996-Prymnesium_polylepis.1